MAASGDYIDNGISMNYQYGGTTYPIEACYRLKTSPEAWGVSRITGIHSSTDNAFGYDIEYILGCVLSGGTGKLSMPALANIVRPYRDDKDFDGLLRLRRLEG